MFSSFQVFQMAAPGLSLQDAFGKFLYHTEDIILTSTTYIGELDKTLY